MGASGGINGNSWQNLSGKDISIKTAGTYNDIIFYTWVSGGTKETVRIQSSSRTNIDMNASMVVKTWDNSSTNFAIKVLDTNSNILFSVRNDGAPVIQSISTPLNIVSAPTVTVTKAFVNSAPNGEMVLVLTNNVSWFTYDMSTFGTNDVGLWAIAIMGTNSITFDTNTISGYAGITNGWVSSTNIANDLMFRKTYGKTTIGVKMP